MMADGRVSGPADYLAAERTFLAWIRTGLALMGFGFVVARFGLFLQSLQMSQLNLPVRPSGLSVWFGTALIALGVFVNLMSAWQHVRLIGELNRGEDAFKRPSSLGIAVALILTAAGLGMAIYLISVREPKGANSQNGKENSMQVNPDAGMVSVQSSHSVDETVQKIEELLRSQGVKLFALVDHSGEAETVGMHMRPTKLLIFGHPKAGTPLMLATPSVAIDLPLKILVAEDDAGKVWISYNSPAYLQKRHGFPQELVQNIAVVAGLAQKGTE
jgi:uncharacterized protein (DUF302 family)/uncharacterized membrane protein YidH (DUF202 family)